VNTPGICLEHAEQPKRWVLRQHRPRIASALVGADFVTAQSRIPLLLPLCQAAQAQAAAAALAALADTTPDTDAAGARALLREQGLSGAWRYLITWPGLLGERTNPQALRVMSEATDSEELAAALHRLLPGLQQVSTLEDFIDWVGNENCAGARLLARAMNDSVETLAVLDAASSEPADAGIAVSEVVEMLQSDTLLKRIEASIRGADEEDFEYSALGVVAGPPPSTLNLHAEMRDEGMSTQTQTGQTASHAGPIYVGALAAGRHPLTQKLASHPRFSLTAKFLGAQILDSVAVADAIAAEDTEALAGVRSLRIEAGDHCVGIGSSTTVRGPLFHVVTQNAQAAADGVASGWQILAPTDWHFAKVELLGRLLASGGSDSDAQLALAALDPCCASSVQSPARPEPIHA
jgi:hypothetical protein